MNSELGWRLRRLVHLVRKVSSSVTARGWRGTFKRLQQEHGRLRSASLRTDATPLADIPRHAPAAGERHRKMLVIDSRAPDPSRDSGSLRLCQMLDLFHQDGWQIDFFADDGLASAEDIARLEAVGVHVHRDDPSRWLRREGDKLDAVLLCRLPVADLYLPLVRRHAPTALLVFDTVDLHFLREQRAAELDPHRRLQRHAQRSRRRELLAITRSDLTLVVSEQERDLLAAELPERRAMVLTNIHPLHDGGDASFEARRDLLFIGGFGHPPNADAVHWFVDEVMPLLRTREPGLILHVAGDIHEPVRKSLQAADIRLHGRVPELAPLMRNSRVSIAPLRFGAGVKGKVNMAMSYGLPVVATSIAAEGMYLVHRENVLIADGAANFAAAVLELYRDEALWRKLSAGGIANVRNHFSVERARETVQAIGALAMQHRAARTT